MSSPLALREKTYQLLETLPPAGLSELRTFLEYLRFKYSPARHARVVALEGLWESIPFDISDEDVRALRRNPTNPFS